MNDHRKLEPGDGSFRRDPINKGALLNTDNEALAIYKKTKKRFKDVRKIEVLENQIAELQSLVKSLIGKIDGSNTIAD